MLDRKTDKAAFDWFVTELCCDCFGSVTGGGRTLKRNQLVGGHSKSKHLNRPPLGVERDSDAWCWAEAADIVFDDIEGKRAACKRIWKHERYVYRDYESTLRIHVQGFPKGMGPWSYRE